MTASNIRGTTQTVRPASRAARMAGTRSSSRVCEKATTTASAPVSRIAAAIVAGVPAGGSVHTERGIPADSGSASMRPTGRMPYCGLSVKRWARCVATTPLPTIRVRDCSRCLRLRSRLAVTAESRPMGSRAAVASHTLATVSPRSPRTSVTTIPASSIMAASAAVVCTDMNSTSSVLCNLRR